MCGKRLRKGRPNGQRIFEKRLPKWSHFPSNGDGTLVGLTKAKETSLEKYARNIDAQFFWTSRPVVLGWSLSQFGSRVGLRYLTQLDQKRASDIHDGSLVVVGLRHR